ncbi:hypothetical protein FHQ18_00585 [Deferribacter autotrophicus]|uniref:Uncharacterized protein n=1 Tax=Deferribacter autotrophicus TaxID=500465 RepID=A0A5A8F850_9BACT|nr:hypothetical protein [Deferribacter autotrophicus]KAA0259408.1 hypothetical protein FHQ18_00585 [Deferribacter autotrophicus]
MKLKRYLIPIIGIIIVVGLIVINGYKYNEQKKIIKYRQQIENQIRKECLNELKILKSRFANATGGVFSSSDESELENIKLRAKELLSKCDIINNDIQTLIIECENKISAIEKKRKNEEERNRLWENCYKEYDILEKEFHKAKGWFNDDEEKIADIKTRAIALKKKCSPFPEIVVEIRNLIRKCNEDL